MPRMTQAVLTALLVLASLAATDGAQPVLALDETLTTCDWATFEPAIAAIQADGGGTLTLDCDGTILFANQITITSDVTIIGGDGAVLSGNNSTRLLVVNAGASLDLVALSVQHGDAVDAGAIINRGTLTITNSTFSNNTSLEGAGGAIINFGTLTITTSTFTGNAASFWGGAIYNDGALTITASTFSDNSAVIGGAIENEGAATVIASTFTGNAASFTGSAISNDGALTITASTFSDNSAGSGGAIRQGGGSTSLSSSILANSTGANCYDASGTLTSSGYNLSDDSTCNLSASGDIQNSSGIHLGALADNGGPTHTILPALDSDAINAADCALSSPFDQRGEQRPASGPFCDIGAVEIGPTETLCANRYTGVLTIPLATGACPGGTYTLAFPLTASLTVCINPYTGALIWSPRGTCSSVYRAHSMPGDGPLHYCWSIYTGKLRYSATGACSAGERPGVIPG